VNNQPPIHHEPVGVYRSLGGKKGGGERRKGRRVWGGVVRSRSVEVRHAKFGSDISALPPAGSMTLDKSCDLSASIFISVKWGYESLPNETTE
jgi:hypothetical protein